MERNFKVRTLLMLIGLILCCGLVNAQIEDVKSKIKEKAEERANNKIDEGIDEGLDEIEEGIDSMLEDEEEDEEDTELDEDAEEEEDERDEPQIKKQSAEKSSKQVPDKKLESYTQYDFVPGDKILLFEDFSQDAIGDFPALWTSNGGGEVKTLSIEAGKWLHMNVADAVYCYSKEIKFPENFIIEFDLIPNEEYNEFELTLYEDPSNDELTTDLYPGTQGLHIKPNTEYGGGWLTNGYYDDKWLEGNSQRNPIVPEELNHVIVWVQKRRVRIYHKGAKVLDMPTNLPPNIKLNRMRFATWAAETQPYVSNIKITTAAPDMRSKLLTEGKLISYGIYFDSGKDVVKPESYGSVKEIADILKENAGVKIKIVGHTDSDGNDAGNLDLSKRRAANVKNYLVNQFQIDASRIETDGKGETEPIESNTSAAGKAKNRRVEFIKL